MITIRPAQARGKADLGWLDTKHTFSFGNYYDPRYLGFKTLRVINEDKVQPNQGFGTHSHSDMEIITYVIAGALEHKDSIGNGSIIRPGDIQRMSAGKGIAHSEFNASSSELVHLLQIWILPEVKGIEPSYEQKYFAPEEKQGKLKLVGSKDGRDNSVTIHQDVNLYVASIRDNEQIVYSIEDNRSVWVQIAQGEIKMGDNNLKAGDGVAIAAETQIVLQAIAPESDILLFDLG